LFQADDKLNSTQRKLQELEEQHATLQDVHRQLRQTHAELDKSSTAQLLSARRSAEVMLQERLTAVEAAHSKAILKLETAQRKEVRTWHLSFISASHLSPAPPIPIRCAC